MKQPEIKYNWHNPNTEEQTAEAMAHLIAEVFMRKVMNNGWVATIEEYNEKIAEVKEEKLRELQAQELEQEQVQEEYYYERSGGRGR